MNSILRTVLVSLLAACGGAQDHSDSSARVDAAAGGVGAACGHVGAGSSPNARATCGDAAGGSSACANAAAGGAGGACANAAADSSPSVRADAAGAGALSANVARSSAPATTGGASGSPASVHAGSGGVDAASSSAAGSGGPAAGATGTDSSIPATFATVKLVLGGGGGIMPCAAAPCHGVHGMAPPTHPLELPPNDDQQLYTNLTTYVSAACDNSKLVEPGRPADSALLKILSGPCGKTPRMPYGCSAEAGDCIPEDYISAVAQWISNGAAH